jgi:hypothetical protein
VANGSGAAGLPQYGRESSQRSSAGAIHPLAEVGGFLAGFCKAMTSVKGSPMRSPPTAATSLFTKWRDIALRPGSRKTFTSSLTAVERSQAIASPSQSRANQGASNPYSELIFLVVLYPTLLLLSEFLAAALVALPTTPDGLPFRLRFESILYPWSVVIVVLGVVRVLGSALNLATLSLPGADVGLCLRGIIVVLEAVYYITLAVTGLSVASMQRRLTVFGLYCASAVVGAGIVALAMYSLLGRAG